MRAYATNSVGTAYGSDVSFTPTSTVTFYYTGAVQTWAAPATGPVVFMVWGAQGGTHGGGNTGGAGGYATGTYAATAGQVFYIMVGQQPPLNTNGSYHPNAFGAGGQGYGTGQSGGGASDVRVANTDPANRIIVAAGGGGASSNGAGGYGGLTTGGAGYYAGSQLPGYCGQGGTPSVGGARATNSTNGSPGYSDFGGMGDTNNGGGGGGGWYGGGGGYGQGGGGGGSSYINGVVTAGSTSGAIKNGNGQVTITY